MEPKRKQMILTMDQMQSLIDLLRDSEELSFVCESGFEVAIHAVMAASTVHSELARVKAENERLRECLQFFQDDQHNKPKHILSFNGRLTDEQFERIKQQCNKEFGIGMFILLEGGLKYEGMTHQQALQQKGANND